MFFTTNPTDFVNTKNRGYRFTRDAEFTFLGSLVDPKYIWTERDEVGYVMLLCGASILFFERGASIL